MPSEPSIGKAEPELDWDRILRKGSFLGRKIAAEYPGIEASDVEQEMFLYLQENRASILRNSNSSGKAVEDLMLKAGRRYAQKERYSFIHYSSEWVYTPAEVRAIFSEAFFDKGVWENMPQKDDGVTITAKNIVVSLWDISNAFDALAPEDQISIRSRDEFALSFADKAAERAYYRAIDKVTQRINGAMAAKSQITTTDVSNV